MNEWFLTEKQVPPDGVYVLGYSARYKSITGAAWDSHCGHWHSWCGDTIEAGDLPQWQYLPDTPEDK